MSQSRKARGRQSEEIVADYLRRNGFPHAERRPASLPGSDITGLVGQDVEVKARRGLDLTAAMKQQSARAADGVLPWAVIRPDGAGPTTVDRWPVVLPLAVMVDLLRAAGYGTPHARPDAWADPAPRVLPGLLAEARASVALDRDETHVVDDLDGWRCACGRADLPDVTHSAQRCAGAETLGGDA